jgi:hypothetical protein
MALLDKLTTQGGSSLTPYDGKTPKTNLLATSLSPLHAEGSTPSYSLNGSNASTVRAFYESYDDGSVNALPQPGQLDLNGRTPKKYIDNLPR